MDNQQYAKNQRYPNPPPYAVIEQQPTYPPPPQPIHHHTNIIASAPVLVLSAPVGPEPQNMVCPRCNNHVRTVMRYEANANTHRNALIICIFCCWPCALLPYFMDSCQNGNHYCSSCNSFIGTYKS